MVESMSKWASAAHVMKVSKIYCSLLFSQNILGPQGLHASCIPQSWITWSRRWAWEAQGSNVYRVEVALQGVRSGVRTRAHLCSLCDLRQVVPPLWTSLFIALKISVLLHSREDFYEAAYTPGKEYTGGYVVVPGQVPTTSPTGCWVSKGPSEQQ